MLLYPICTLSCSARQLTTLAAFAKTFKRRTINGIYAGDSKNTHTPAFLTRINLPILIIRGLHDEISNYDHFACCCIILSD